MSPASNHQIALGGNSRAICVKCVASNSKLTCGTGLRVDLAKQGGAAEVCYDEDDDEDDDDDDEPVVGKSIIVGDTEYSLPLNPLTCSRLDKREYN